jgi:hypothetical protein
MSKLTVAARAALLGLLVSVAGCASLGVRPWQRDLMAREDMQLDANALDTSLDEHMYFSKEASTGGRSFAGGGCGCN